MRAQQIKTGIHRIGIVLLAVFAVPGALLYGAWALGLAGGGGAVGLALVLAGIVLYILAIGIAWVIAGFTGTGG
jgi:hypothetical protein